MIKDLEPIDQEILDTEIRKLKQLPEFETQFENYRDTNYQKLFDQWFLLLSPEEKKEVEALTTKGRIKGSCLN